MNENLINLFGTFLSGILNKSPLACKGLVRFAIIRYLRIHKLPEEKSISLEEFHAIVTEIIKYDLINANFTNVDSIIEQIKTESNLQKAIFSMSI